MSDPNRENFEHRLLRIDRLHSSGQAFEAPGTLGRRFFDSNRPLRRRKLWMRPLALMLLGFLAVKGGLYAHLGAETYAYRVQVLEQGTLVEKAGSWVLRPDTVTKRIGGLLQPYLG
jgi:hypothetical protein